VTLAHGFRVVGAGTTALSHAVTAIARDSCAQVMHGNLNMGNHHSM
jgi:hypothetical protein